MLIVTQNTLYAHIDHLFDRPGFVLQKSPSYRLKESFVTGTARAILFYTNPLFVLVLSILD